MAHINMGILQTGFCDLGTSPPQGRIPLTCISGSRNYWGYITPIMENQMEKNMENEMETGVTWRIS